MQHAELLVSITGELTHPYLNIIYDNGELKSKTVNPYLSDKLRGCPSCHVVHERCFAQRGFSHCGTFCTALAVVRHRRIVF